MSEQPMEVPPDEYQKKKTAYCQSFALRHRDVLKIHRDVGILGRKAEALGFRNVSEHCLVAGIFADIICELAGMAPEMREKVVKAAILHDWDKKNEATKVDAVFFESSRKKRQPSLSLRDVEDIKREQMQFLISKDVEEEVIRLSQANIPPSVEGPLNLPEKIIWFVDAMLYDTEPVSISKRMFESSGLDWTSDPEQNIRVARNRAISCAYQERYQGKTLLDVQKEIAPRVSHDIAKAIKYQEDPLNLPQFLKEKFVERVMHFSA